MKKVCIYGAGKRGRKFENLLTSNGISVAAFLDSNKSDNAVISINGREYSIINVSKVSELSLPVIVAVADINEVIKITKTLEQLGIEVVTVESVLYETGYSVEARRDFVLKYHDSEMQDYFADAENSLDIFWNEESIFKTLFDKLDTSIIVELACGHGRHVQKYVDKVEKVMLIDISEENIEFCKKRFSGDKRITCYKNDGYDLSMIADESCTSLFTYDAMVHFEFLDIYNYLKETRRILKENGMALFHHSNNTEDYTVSFSTGTCGRNYMSKDLFAFLASRAGLKIVKQEVIDWGANRNLDCVTLLKK